MRIALRPLVPSDAAHLCRWSADEETRRLQAARAAPHTLQSASEEVTRIRHGHGVAHLAFMIEVDGTTVGNCWLGHLTAGSASLGIVIGDPEFRGRGVGTEVMRQLLDLAGSRSVSLWTLASNERALALYRRVGFREVSRTVRDLPLSGRVETIDMQTP